MPSSDGLLECVARDEQSTRAVCCDYLDSTNNIQSKGAIVVYLSPYSPDLNPIKLIFSAYKRRFQRLNKTGIDWYTCHSFSLDVVASENAISYFRHSDVLIHKGPSGNIARDEIIQYEYTAAVVLLLFFPH